MFRAIGRRLAGANADIVMAVAKMFGGYLAPIVGAVA